MKESYGRSLWSHCMMGLLGLHACWEHFKPRYVCLYCPYRSSCSMWWPETSLRGSHSNVFLPKARCLSSLESPWFYKVNSLPMWYIIFKEMDTVFGSGDAKGPDTYNLAWRIVTSLGVYVSFKDNQNKILSGLLNKPHRNALCS